MIAVIIHSKAIFFHYHQSGSTEQIPRLSLSLSLTFYPYEPSLLGSLPDSIQCLHRADECKFYWLVNTGVSMCRRILLMSLSFLHQLYPVCHAHLIWMVCEMGSTWPHSAAFKFFSKQHAASLCSSHLTFSLNISLEFMWCNHTIVLTQPQLKRISPFYSFIF